jgi:hypothetical protein
MATPGQKDRKVVKAATSQNPLGILIGAVLTGVAAHKGVREPALLAIITPASVGMEWLLIQAWGEVSSYYREWKVSRRNDKALGLANKELQNPDLPTHHKEQLQEIRQQIVVNSINGVAFNPVAPQTKSNSKPAIGKE